MDRTQKILTASLWALMVIAMLALVTLGIRTRWQRKSPAIDIAPIVASTYTVPPFSLIDQNGRPFTNQDLRGSVWIADFIFTRCHGPCPVMTKNMAQMQPLLVGTPVKLVSFSIDPGYDTPQVLKKYAQEHGADESRWTLLTGKEQDIHALAKAMNIGITRPTGDDPPVHSTYFVLVDSSGKIQGYYRGQDDQDWRRLAADAAALALKRTP